MSDEKTTGEQPAKSPMTDQQKRELIARLQKDLKRQEEISAPGATSLGPKQQLLDAREVEKKNPDKRVRWVSLRNPDKMLSRKAEGYDILPEKEGGRRLGENMVLMSIPREKYEKKLRDQEKLNKDRMRQHKTDMERMAESVSRQLRDQYGLDVPVERLLVNEAE